MMHLGGTNDRSSDFGQKPGQRYFGHAHATLFCKFSNTSNHQIIMFRSSIVF